MAESDKMDYDNADDIACEARDRLKEWDGEFGEWVTEAKDCYAMLHGDQWSAEDVEAMREQKRPIVTMNRIAAMIRGVCGLEVSQRQEVRYLAPELGDVQSTELQNAAAKWSREQCDAEDEESEAFRDLLTCGMGWTETRVDYDEDPQGKLIIERIDPMDMRWDPLAQKKGLADSRWRARLKRMSTDDIKNLWPDKADQIAAYVENLDGIAPTPHVNFAGDAYRNDDDIKPGTKDEVTVTQYQYWRHVFMVKVMTPDGQALDMSADRVATMKKSGLPLQEGPRYRVREYRQAIVCGPVELEDEKLDTTHFTLNCMTGVRDRNKGYWYGLVRDMIDPQKWANKFFTTFIDIVATNAKGGVMAESSAVEDPRKFEESWSNPRSTVWLKTGGLSKIKNRDAPNLPAAIPQMMEFAIGSLPHVSGINLEFLGTTNREQSGVLEYHRKQSVANSLAEFFAAMRQYRKVQGRVMLELIYAFLADGRLVRIVGKTGEQYLPLYKQADVKYDVIVDEAPSAPDRKMQTWLALQELLPMALKAGLPVPPDVLDYSPLPAALAMEWKKLMAAGPQIPPQVQQQMQEMQKQLQQLQQENVQLKDKKQEAMAELQLDAQKSQAEMALEQQATKSKMELAEREAAHKQRLAELEFQMEQARAQREAELEEFKIRKQLELEEFKVASQSRLAERKSVLDAANQEQQNDIAAGKANLTFEKKQGKIQSVTDGNGKRYRIERGADGKLTGLKPETTIQ